MFHILYLIIFLTFSFNSIAQQNGVDIKNYCLDRTCTNPIKELKISNFSFKTRNCETKDYRKCLVWFGTKKNSKRISWVKYYRIINGPIPNKPSCLRGKPVWFQDLPFPRKQEKSNYLEIFKNLNYQHREKMYFHRSPIATFNYFSSSDKSIGVLVHSKNFKGIEKNKIFIFNTENDDMKIIEPICNK